MPEQSQLQEAQSSITQMGGYQTVQPELLADVIARWRERLLKIIMRGATIIGFPAIVAVLFYYLETQNWFELIFMLIVYGVLVVATFARVPYKVRAYILILVIFAFYYDSLAYGGVRGAAGTFLMTYVLFALMLLGMRTALVFLGLGVFILVGLGWGVVNQQIALALLLDQLDPYIWLVYGIIPIVLVGIVSVGVITMQWEFSASQKRERDAMKEVYRERAHLAERVAERTRDLQIASKVSHQITQVLNLEELLPHLVEQTKNGFGLNFVSVFLYEHKSRRLILEAGTGDVGRQMKADGKMFAIEATPSVVAQAGRERRAIVIKDVSQSATHLDNPYLPETKSEAAVPMLIQNELIGVLDLQAQEVGRFAEAELQILTTLAEQIGIAIRNARLYQVQVQVAEQLRQVDRMKSQFLSSMSHELRTPLNAIINFVEMVSLGMVGPISEEQKELLDYALQSSTHLLHLINDVLDISKIQAGRLTLFIEQDVNLYQEVETAVKMMDAMFTGKGVQLVQDIDDNLPLIAGDKRRIRQVLLNLLSNAAKFTDEGTVTLSAKYQGDHIVFAVIDTGPGIALEAQTTIFEPFVQTADGVKLEQGTGLGLPISRSLVQAHGGKLWLESQPGEGAAFYFTLPTAQKASVQGG